MTTTSTPPTSVASSRPRPVRPDDDRFVDLAAQLGERCAASADEHDRDASFVTEAYDAFRETGYLKMAVPEELGGGGATMRQVCFAQAELARWDGSSALAANMHLYITLLQGYRRRTGAPDAEGVLRRVVDDDAVLMTSGGSDWLWSNGTAVRENGGYRVSGRKAFCSQAPVASVLTTSAVHELPDGTREVLLFGAPMSDDAVRIIETWDTLGMRGTGSHDVELTDLIVPEDKIVARREWGKLDAPLQAAALHIAPTAAAVYWGVAAGARDQAVAMVSKMHRGPEPMTDLPRVHRQIGLMDSRLRVGWWSVLGALDELGEDYTVTPEAGITVMIAKREAVEAAVEVTDTALDMVGGPSYYRKAGLERTYRDARAGKYHPLTPEATLYYAGRVAVGGPADVE